MHYRVYSGPKGSPDLSPFEKSRMLFKEFTVLDDALSWARHLEGTGRISLLIEGDDGTRMNRRAILDTLRVGMREQLEASRLHSARARAVRWFHLLPTTSQFTIGRCATVALSEFVTAWLVS